jgi:hypothetical protein
VTSLDHDEPEASIAKWGNVSKAVSRCLTCDKVIWYVEGTWGGDWLHADGCGFCEEDNHGLPSAPDATKTKRYPYMPIKKAMRLYPNG